MGCHASKPNEISFLVIEGKPLDVEQLEDCVIFDLFVKDETGKIMVTVVVKDVVDASQVLSVLNKQIDVKGMMRPNGIYRPSSI